MAIASISYVGSIGIFARCCCTIPKFEILYYSTKKKKAVVEIALDATNVVLTFNRAHIQLFHYLVSLRMSVLAILLSIIVHSFSQYYYNALNAWKLGVAASACLLFIRYLCSFHQESTVYTPHVNSGKGSLKKFAERPNLGGLSWNRFLLLVGPIALLSMRLTIYVLDDWTVIIPMVICLAEVYILFFFLPTICLPAKYAQSQRF